MKILGNKILIQPTEPIDKLPSGLYLPQTAVQKPNTGTVVLVGEDANQTLQGRKVLYNSAVAIPIDGNHLLHVLDIKFITS